MCGVLLCFLRGSKLISRLVGLVVVLLACYMQSASATPQAEVRGRLSYDKVPIEEQTLRYSPLNLQGGSSLTLISPAAWSPLGAKLSKVLETTHSKFSGLIGSIPSIDISLRLMDEETFFLSTGAPRWTNALYFKGQIIIPLSTREPYDMDNISRSIKHEYTHAIVHALSEGKCPGWIDEGLAQWAEGSENPALKPALFNYLKRNPPVLLSSLQGGFTKLDKSKVAAAYAQSLIAVQAIIRTFGFPAIRNYLDALRDGENKESAFILAFSMTNDTFEEKLSGKLASWARTPANRVNSLSEESKTTAMLQVAASY